MKDVIAILDINPGSFPSCSQFFIPYKANIRLWIQGSGPDNFGLQTRCLSGWGRGGGGLCEESCIIIHLSDNMLQPMSSTQGEVKLKRKQDCQVWDQGD